jgi:hypothetical protein
MKIQLLLVLIIVISVVFAGCFSDEKDSDLDDSDPFDGDDGKGDGNGTGPDDQNTTKPDDENNTSPDDTNKTMPDDNNNTVPDENKTVPDDNNTVPDDNNTAEYFLHENITVTIFWIGEEAKEENGWVPNTKSAWDDKWQDHFGGVDDPGNRNGYYPAGFTPNQNPFYFAMPYNDFNGSGRKAEVYDIIPWADSEDWAEFDSMCKNQWIKVTKGDKSAYVQWEDTGPFREDDAGYVFGEDRPKDEKDEIAGLDVSPAVRDYLSLKNYDTVHWQFVDAEDVPEGPWKDIVTTQQTYWE